MYRLDYETSILIESYIHIKFLFTFIYFDIQLFICKMNDNYL